MARGEHCARIFPVLVPAFGSMGRHEGCLHMSEALAGSYLRGRSIDLTAIAGSGLLKLGAARIPPWAWLPA